jgi:hypothetical protein
VGVRAVAGSVRAGGFAVLAAGVLAVDAAAQEPARHDIVGVVVDRATGTPLASVAVDAEGHATVHTNAAGAFVLPGATADTVVVRARLLGYQPGTATYVRSAGGAAPPSLRIELAPDPVALGAIQVVVDRFENRRRATPYALRAYSLDALAESAAADITGFVREKAIVTECPTGFGMCAYGRGRYSRPQVFLNDAPLMGGLDALRGWPKDDFYRVEVGRPGGGLVVHAYTKWYIERITRQPPQPHLD